MNDHDEYVDEAPVEVDNRDDAAERSVLGGLMYWANARDGIAKTGLRGSHFYSPKHEIVYDAIMELDGDGKSCDALGVFQCLLDRGDLKLAGGHGYIADLYLDAITPEAAIRDAQRVIELASKRDADRFAVHLRQMIRDPQTTAADLMDAIGTGWQPLTVGREAERSSRVGDLFDETLDSFDPAQATQPGLGWPWFDANLSLNPMTPGQLIVVAARFGVGKSIACANIGWHVAHRLNRSVLICTTEMSDIEYMQRLISATSGVHLKRMKRRILNVQDWDRVAAAREKFDAASMNIVHTPELSLAELRALIRKHKPDLAIVDQMAQMIGPNPKAEERDKLGELAYGMKTMAGVEGLPILAAAQVNRMATTRTDKKPTRDDIADSDKIARAADLLLLIHREDMQEPESPRVGEVDLIVAKQRDGDLDTFTLANQGHCAKFVDMVADGAEVDPDGYVRRGYGGRTPDEVLRGAA